jgi:hypothetical protein
MQKQEGVIEVSFHNFLFHTKIQHEMAEFHNANCPSQFVGRLVPPPFTPGARPQGKVMAPTHTPKPNPHLLLSVKAHPIQKTINPFASFVRRKSTFKESMQIFDAGTLAAWTALEHG